MGFKPRPLTKQSSTPHTELQWQLSVSDVRMIDPECEFLLHKIVLTYSNNCLCDLPFSRGHRKCVTSHHLFEVLCKNPSGHLLKVLLRLEVAILFYTTMKFKSRSFLFIMVDKHYWCRVFFRNAAME